MEDIDIRLTGGILFNLIREAGYGRNRVVENASNNKNKNTDPLCMLELIRIFDPGFTMSTGRSFQTAVSAYKSCAPVRNKGALPLNNQIVRNNFFLGDRATYTNALERTQTFIKRFINVEERGKWLAASILQLIQMDKAITLDDFLINCYFIRRFRGESEDSFDGSHVRLDRLLLGSWYYCLQYADKNTDGKATYDWLYETEIKGRPRKLRDGLIGVNAFQITLLDNTEEHSDSKLVLPDEEGPALDIDKFKSYLKKTQAKYSKVKTLLYGVSPCNFYDIYVPGTLRLRHRLRRVPLPSFYIKSVDAPSLIRYSQYVIITGTGGLGKSMMMRHLFLSSAKNIERNQRLPIFAPLNNYDPETTSIENYLFAILSSYDKRIQKEDLERLLTNGCCILLLDGIDEINSDKQSIFQKKLNIFMNRYDLNQFIMSSRPSVFSMYERFTVFQLMPMEKEQSLQLIKQLQFSDEGKLIKERFIDKLNKELYVSHRDFASNPLLLTIMLMTFEQYADIPSKVHIFYQEAYETLAQKHDASKGGFSRKLKTGLSSEEYAKYFAEFCSRSYIKEKFDFSRDDFSRIFDSLNIVKKQPIKMDDFIYDACTSICLMYYEGTEYHFAHRSFQEYFCALYFSKQKDKNLLKIGRAFEQKKQRGYTDETFAMLYDMIPDKVEEYIFLPYLEKIFSKIKGADPDDVSIFNPNIAVQCYTDFLKTIYPIINYDEGEVSDYSETEPSSFLYSFIVKNKHLKVIYPSEIVDVIPGDDEFMSEEYTYFDRHWDAPEELNIGHEEELTNVKDLPDEYLENNDYEVVGRSYSIKTADIIDHSSDYAPIYEAITDEDFVLREEFNDVYKYYTKLKAKIEGQSGDDLFDSLD